jgi:hypothetical protein
MKTKTKPPVVLQVDLTDAVEKVGGESGWGWAGVLIWQVQG